MHCNQVEVADGTWKASRPECFVCSEGQSLQLSSAGEDTVHYKILIQERPTKTKALLESVCKARSRCVPEISEVLLAFVSV